MLPTIAGETTISSSAQPAAEISSPTQDSAVIPKPPPVVLLRDVDAQVSARGQRFPKLARRFAGIALALHVLAAEAIADARHRFSQHGLLLRGHERQ